MAMLLEGHTIAKDNARRSTKTGLVRFNTLKSATGPHQDTFTHLKILRSPKQWSVDNRAAT
jgi:hypothetical protein